MKTTTTKREYDKDKSIYKEGDRIYDFISDRYGWIVEVSESRLVVVASWDDCPRLKFNYVEENLLHEPRWQILRNRFDVETMHEMYDYDN